MRELRIHRRRNRGTTPAAKVLAATLSSERRSVQVFPASGIERCGWSIGDIEAQRA
jgi:hypothetical protein